MSVLGKVEIVPVLDVVKVISVVDNLLDKGILDFSLLAYLLMNNY